ncbi:MAG: hypothetical protein ACE5Q3_03455 [Alphaproteobacteria bacterium]
MLATRVIVLYGVYMAAGLAIHLAFYGGIEWAGVFVYVVMVFWPIFLLFEAFKLLLVFVLVVVAMGVAVHLLLRIGSGLLGGR